MQRPKNTINVSKAEKILKRGYIFRILGKKKNLSRQKFFKFRGEQDSAKKSLGMQRDTAGHAT
jgi:hypothetical protein